MICPEQKLLLNRELCMSFGRNASISKSSSSKSLYRHVIKYSEIRMCHDKEISFALAGFCSGSLNHQRESLPGVQMRLAGSAMGAGAIGQRFRQPSLSRLDIQSAVYAAGFIDEIEDVGIIEAVIDIAPLSARNDQSFAAQNHELLGNIRLPPPRCSFQVTDASFSAPNCQQDLQMRRFSKVAEKL